MAKELVQGHTASDVRLVNLVCLSTLPPCLSSLPAHRRHGKATCHMYMQPLPGTWKGDTCVHGLIVLQAISFFTSDVNYLFEGVYYGPLAVLTCLLLISCSITSCLILGPTALIATLCYLLILPLQVNVFLCHPFDVGHSPELLGLWNWGCF